jgi:hypothetical protein
LSAQQKRFKEITTPKGTAVFPKLIQPDTKFDKDGTYSVKMKFPKADEEKLVALLTAEADKAYAELLQEKKKKSLKRADMPWKPEVEKVKDEEGTVVEEVETGFLLFTFKLNAQYKTKEGEVKYNKPLIYDSKGVRIKDTGSIDIGGGSVLRVACKVKPFFTDTIGAGITLKLSHVQIIELVERGERSAKSLGFDSEEGGWEGSSVASLPSAGAPEDSAPDPADSDF